MLNHWNPFRDLKLMFVGSRRTDQLNLRSQQHIVSTVEDSVLRTEMVDLESQDLTIEMKPGLLVSDRLSLS
jgi:hypothetical protein